MIVKKWETAEKVTLGSIAVVLFMGGALALYWEKLPPQMPWFYSLPWGDKQLVSKVIMAISLGGLLLGLGATYELGKWVGREDKIVKTITAIGTAVITLTFAASFWRVLSIFLNN